ALAEARAQAAAKACAAAAAFAGSIAEAAANSAATAQTSVDVIPDIETSTRAFVNPDCLQPTCRQYEVCEEPGCPTPLDLSWEFPELTPGATVHSVQNFPQDLMQAVANTGAIYAERLQDDLPPGLTFDLAMEQRVGILQGQVPAQGGSWRAVFRLYDSRECPVITLTVYISAAPQPQPQPTQLSARFSYWRGTPICEEGVSHEILLQWEISGGTSPYQVGPFLVRYPDGRQLFISRFFSGTEGTIQVNYPDGGTFLVQAQVRDSQGRTATMQTQIQLTACLPVVQLVTVNLEVRAWRYIYGSALTRLPAQQEPEELKVPILIVGEERPRLTPFVVQRIIGSKVTLQAPLRTEGAAYGLGFKGWLVWYGDADKPVVYKGTTDQRRGINSLTIQLNQPTRVVAVYQDIIG
ncbi:MAG: hypothetical protein GXO72_02570, partial [Caldiserica bacterium]|nr:hypothetical protein [Caldisericota bacterium]